MSKGDRSALKKKYQISEQNKSLFAQHLDKVGIVDQQSKKRKKKRNKFENYGSETKLLESKEFEGRVRA